MRVHAEVGVINIAVLSWISFFFSFAMYVCA